MPVAELKANYLPPNRPQATARVSTASPSQSSQAGAETNAPNHKAPRTEEACGLSEKATAERLEKTWKSLQIDRSVGDVNARELSTKSPLSRYRNELEQVKQKAPGVSARDFLRLAGSGKQKLELLLKRPDLNAKELADTNLSTRDVELLNRRADIRLTDLNDLDRGLTQTLSEADSNRLAEAATSQLLNLGGSDIGGILRGLTQVTEQYRKAQRVTEKTGLSPIRLEEVVQAFEGGHSQVRHTDGLGLPDVQTLERTFQASDTSRELSLAQRQNLFSQEERRRLEVRSHDAGFAPAVAPQRWAHDTESHLNALTANFAF